MVSRSVLRVCQLAAQCLRFSRAVGGAGGMGVFQFAADLADLVDQREFLLVACLQSGQGASVATRCASTISQSLAVVRAQSDFALQHARLHRAGRRSFDGHLRWPAGRHSGPAPGARRRCRARSPPCREAGGPADSDAKLHRRGQRLRPECARCGVSPGPDDADAA